MNRLPDLPAGADGRISGLIADGRTRLDQRRTRRRRASIAITAAAAVALATSGYAVITIATQREQARSTWCYAGETTDTQSTQVGTPDEQTDKSGRATGISDPSDRVASAIDLCASAWRAGILTDGKATGVPALVPCIRTDEVIAVYVRDPGATRDDAQICADNGQRPAR